MNVQVAIDAVREALVGLRCAEAKHLAFGALELQFGRAVGVRERRDTRTGEPVTPWTAHEVDLYMSHCSWRYGIGSTSLMSGMDCGAGPTEDRVARDTFVGRTVEELEIDPEAGRLLLRLSGGATLIARHPDLGEDGEPYPLHFSFRVGDVAYCFEGDPLVAEVESDRNDSR